MAEKKYLTIEFGQWFRLYELEISDEAIETVVKHVQEDFRVLVEKWNLLPKNAEQLASEEEVKH